MATTTIIQSHMTCDGYAAHATNSSIASTKQHMNAWFDRVASTTDQWAGTPLAFIASVTLVLVWAVLGPVFDYSDAWQLSVNTTTTIVTFWLCFVIQGSQTRDTLAMNAKLDELVVAIAGARDELAGIEAMSEDEISELRR
jgi:low affinity Fe/Cu permease